MTKIIAISGKKQSGKNTLSSYIEEFAQSKNYSVGKYSFAYELKYFLVNAMMLDNSQVWGSEPQKNTKTQYLWDNLPEGISQGRTGFITSRELMQIFGTDVMRNMFSDTIWTDNTISRILNDSYDFALIEDLRFQNEIRSLLKYPSYFIRLTRGQEQGDSHVSEKNLDSFNWDLEIPNQRYCLIPNNLNKEETWEKAKEYMINVVKI